MPLCGCSSGPSDRLIYNMKAVNTSHKFPCKLSYKISGFLSGHIVLYFLPHSGQNCPIDQTAKNVKKIDLEPVSEGGFFSDISYDEAVSWWL